MRVEELARRASSSRAGRPPASLSAVFTKLDVPKRDQQTITETFATMCRLHTEGRDHIWGYYIRNMARPMWLARETNRVDLLIGNPPWLAYRNMYEDMQATFKIMSERRNLWAGRELATHQDLSGLFVVRATELYLRKGGRLAMVLPNAALDREQFEGFRRGNYSGRAGNMSIAFDGSWDLRRIRPHFFPRGSSVIFARRSDEPEPMSDGTVVWKGKLDKTNCDWTEARGRLARTPGRLMRVESAAASSIGDRFSQGATFNPRVVFIVKERPAGPLGLPAGRMGIKSSRSVNEKLPYKDLPSLEGVVESEFVRPVYSGENLLPYRVVAPLQAVIPCSTAALLNEREIDQYSGLSNWWAKATKLWEEHKAAATTLTLSEQLDYHAKMSKQLPVVASRLVYNASGMHLAAAKVQNHRAVITKSLYWAAFRQEDEADYLCAILNSAATTDLLRPFMSYGKDERHVDKHLWQLPIPDFDPEDDTHRELVVLSRTVTQAVNAREVDANLHFAATRRRIRQEIEASASGKRISKIVTELLVRRC